MLIILRVVTSAVWITDVAKNCTTSFDVRWRSNFLNFDFHSMVVGGHGKQCSHPSSPFDIYVHVCVIAPIVSKLLSGAVER